MSDDLDVKIQGGHIPTRVVDPKTVDSVTIANTKNLGDAPAMAMGQLFQGMSSAMQVATQNMVANQQQANVMHQAATTQGVSLLYTVDTAADANSTLELLLPSLIASLNAVTDGKASG
ncbi:MAG: RebB family R body protein [Planctomycetota bacterium]